MEALAKFMAGTVRPSPSLVGRAIDAYLRCAYEGAPPGPVAALADEVRRAPAGALYDCPAFERDAPPGVVRYALRLGNRYYPHMKLVIEHLPSRDAWFFRADTHDEHVAVAPTDPDYPAFQALTAHNRAVAAAIESAWTLDGLDTFRAFLRRDLESRRP